MGKKYIFTLCIAFLLSVLFMFYFGEWNVLSFINAMTFVSLIYIAVGLFLLVLGRGFFTGIGYSFRKFLRVTSKKWQMIEGDQKDDYYPKKRSYTIMPPLLIIGIGLFLVMYILSFLFYV